MSPTTVQKLRLGVLGTLVWDVIMGPDRSDPMEDWGGLAYALGALDATLDPAWEVVPLAKVGRDMEEEARALFAELQSVSDTSGVLFTDGENNRVALHYTGPSRRVETLSGGVPPWTWDELEAWVGRLDALYVNFISGFELPLEVAVRLRSAVRGPTYADLHSLFLGLDADGRRFHRPLENALEWCRAFHAVQVNEDELAQLATGERDPWAWARWAIGQGVGEILVTLGAGGAARVGPTLDGPVGGDAAVIEMPTSQPGAGDPTGCGDVWGATFFGGRLAGVSLTSAMERANRVAGINLRARGATRFRAAAWADQEPPR
ncbi:MAG: hypothetical protein HKO53_02220 [Gemmatimonadetes bacterium]|nr:hypothetical protein [Gemmatimonadota bacterium]